MYPGSMHWWKTRRAETCGTAAHCGEGRESHGHTTWPFGFSLLLVPFLLVGGASMAAATIPSLLSFGLLPPAALALARRLYAEHADE